MVSVGDVDATTQSKSFIQLLCNLTLLQDNLYNIIKSSTFVSKQTSAKSLLAFVLLLFFKRESQLSSFFVCLWLLICWLAKEKCTAKEHQKCCPCNKTMLTPVVHLQV